MGALTVYQPEAKKRAAELDKRIRSRMLTFVELAKDLMEMRDSEGWKTLDGFNENNTFEEYVRTVQDLGARYARQIIRSSMVFNAITKGATGSVSPESERQCRIIADKVARFVVKKVHGSKPGQAPPVSISNPDEVRQAWDVVLKKYREYVDRVQAENQAILEANPEAKVKLPLRLSSTRVYEALPKKYTGGDRMIKRNTDQRSFMKCCRLINELTDMVERFQLTDLQALKAIAAKEAWAKHEKANFRQLLSDVVEVAEQVMEGLKHVRVKGD